MFYNHIKTFLLLALLSALLMIIGGLLGGTTGISIAFALSLLINSVTYWYGDKIALAMYDAKPLDKKEHEWIYSTVKNLATTMQLPMPTLWLVESNTANAFATGRSPHHASIAVTTRIITLLEKHELRGVLAHELAHIKNRDMLVTTMAAVMASAIMYSTDIMKFTVYLGDHRNEKEQKNSPIVLFLVALITPIAATLLQLAISRSREYLADETGSHHCKDPLALASALKKLELDTKNPYRTSTEEPAAMHALCIVNPLNGAETIISLFQTHPPISSRITRLRAMYEKMF